MKTGLRLLTLFLIVLLGTVSLAACGGGAEPTETPTPTPTPTATPEPTPAELPPNAFRAELLGQEVIITTDDSGAFTEAVTASSADGSITLEFASGTILQARDGSPVRELSATLNQEPVQPDDGSKIVGPTVTFHPNLTSIIPDFTMKYDYSALLDEIATVENAEVYLARFIPSSETWGKFYDSALDTDNNVASVPLKDFTTDYTIALMAAPPKDILKAEGPPENGVDIVIEYVSEVAASEPGTLTVKTLPGALVLTWWVNPSTGSRSSRPEDRYRQADENGIITWEFTMSKYHSRGEGRFEFYVTTSTDEAFLTAFQANRLDTIFPDRAEEIARFQQGLIEQLELDEQTTLKMYPFIIVRGR